MKRIGMTMGLVALLAVAIVTVLVTQIQIIAGTMPNVTLIGAYVCAPLVALIIGMIAGWQAAQQSPDDPVKEAVGASVFTGVGALLGSLIGFAVLFFLLGDNPDIQSLVRNSEPHPEARIPVEWIPSLGAATGALLGLMVGFFHLAASAFGGLLAGVLYRGRHTPTGAYR